MNLRQLTSFLSLVEEGSFTKAARRLRRQGPAEPALGHGLLAGADPRLMPVGGPDGVGEGVSIAGRVEPPEAALA